MIVVSKTKQGINSIEYVDRNKRGKYALRDTIEEIMEKYGKVEKDQIDKKIDCAKIDYIVTFDNGIIDELRSFEMFVVLLE